MNFNNKTIIITGGNAGIGAAAAIKFAEKGASLALIDIAPQLDEELEKTLLSLGCKLRYYTCNVADEKQVETVYNQIVADFGGFDVSVNNAGILGVRQRLDTYPSDTFDAVIDVNIKGVWYCMKQAATHFIATQKQGVIVNTASVAGHVGMAGHIAYSASKHAVVGMTKTAATEFGKQGIRVNAICPGFTETAMLHNADTDEKYRETLKFLTPLRRFGKAEEIADGILYLASEKATFMTGQSLILDGGLSIQ